MDGNPLSVEELREAVVRLGAQRARMKALIELHPVAYRAAKEAGYIRNGRVNWRVIERDLGSAVDG